MIVEGAVQKLGLNIPWLQKYKMNTCDQNYDRTQSQLIRIVYSIEEKK